MLIPAWASGATLSTIVSALGASTGEAKSGAPRTRRDRPALGQRIRVEPEQAALVLRLNQIVHSE